MFKFGLPLAALLASAAPVLAQPPKVKPEVRILHENLIVLDTHFDTPANQAVPTFDIRKRNSVEDGSQVDYPRMVDGGVDGGFFAVFTPQGANTPEGNRAARDHALLRTMVIHEMAARNADLFTLATKADEAAAISASGKRFVYISMENGSPVASDLTLMNTFYDMGVRMMSPVHFANNDLADSATDPKGPIHGGLSPLGKQFVAEANRLGILLDASHAADTVLDQMLDQSTAPIILSHSGVRAIYNHPRNVSDELLRKLAAKGGVIQINAFSNYMKDIPENPERRAALIDLTKTYGQARDVTPDKREAYRAARKAIDDKYPVPRANMDDLMAHILHAAKVAGKDHVGVSGDFDGGGGIEGFEDITYFPALTERLVAAGWTKQELAGFWGGNALRALRQADALKAK